MLVEVIRDFNFELKYKVREKGFSFLDVHKLTDRGDGIPNVVWHLDSVHLSPDGVLEACRRYLWLGYIAAYQPSIKTALQNHPETYKPAYLDALQTRIEALHRLTNSSSRRSPDEPVFLNYRGAATPDNKDFHPAKIDPGR